MAYALWGQAPISSPPAGVTVSTVADGTLAVGSDRAQLMTWQRDLLIAGEISASDLLGSGEGDYVDPPVEISAATHQALQSLLALDNAATQGLAIKDAIEALRAASGE